MRLNFIKKSIMSVISSLLLLASVPSVNTFASLDDFLTLGGSYEDVRSAVISRQMDDQDDKTKYECHHLIARWALNDWADHIRAVNHAKRHHNYNDYDFDPDEGALDYNKYEEFLMDEDQKWGPSIIMEKADHEKTLSYCNDRSTREKRNMSARYLREQADRLIERGDIMGVIMDEINFIKNTFGHKYDRAIKEVLEYVKSLNFRHVDRKILIMNNPYNPKWYFKYNFMKDGYDLVHQFDEM